MRTIAVLTFLGLGFGVCQCGGSTTTTTPGTDASTDTTGSDSPSGGDSPSGDGGACGPNCNTRQGRLCCSGQCVNPDNDPFNCGGCGVTCTGATPYCDGTCKAPVCLDGGACAGGSGFCCGEQCCTTGQLCCKDEGPLPNPNGPTCFSPTAQQMTCPVGCAPLCVSDRNVKRDIVPVRGREVLEALASVPMSTWSYKSDDPSVRHLGPMAQDLHDAFGLGPTDKAYDPIDAHGVAFASIQALYDMVKAQNARIDRLEAENAKLRSVCP